MLLSLRCRLDEAPLRHIWRRRRLHSRPACSLCRQPWTVANAPPDRTLSRLRGFEGDARAYKPDELAKCFPEWGGLDDSLSSSACVCV